MLALLLAALCVGASAETYMVTMRDGIQLHTIVDKPLFDNTPRAVVFDRSPYGENEIERVADIGLLFGFVAVRQDMRGTKKSQGNFTIWHHEANDAYDTMQWIVQQPWSNGVVYMTGISADGLNSFAAVEDRPPWLHAQVLIFASSVGHEVIYPGGALAENLAIGWLNKTCRYNDGPHAIADLKANEAPGVWWNSLNMTGRYNDVAWPSVMWAGWYDIFLVGQLLAFDGYQNLANNAFQGQSKIVVDPLGHCQSAAEYFPQNLIAGRSLLPLFLAIDLLTNSTKLSEHTKAVTFYVMGPNELFARGNYWTTLDDWPEFTPTAFYLNSSGSLQLTPPAADSDQQSFLYDPENPVPTIGGNNLLIECGPLDQSDTEAPNRDDVLTFTSDVLADDVWVTGPLIAQLFVSTNASDTDFTVKLTDVHSDESSLLIQDGIIRMRWRNLPNPQPEPTVPGQIYEVSVSLWNTSYVFNKGHRIRVSVSSSNYPRFSVNPNNGLALNQTGPVYVAENTVFMSDLYPSAIVLPVVQPSQLPKIPLLNSQETLLDVVDDKSLAAAQKWMNSATSLEQKQQ